LGVILFFAGIELALVIKDIKLKRQNLFVLLLTAGIAMCSKKRGRFYFPF
jgi:hypothetical protein